jgi:hypothetical protein
MIQMHPDAGIKDITVQYQARSRMFCYLVSGDLVKGLADSQHPALDFSLKKYEIRY